jgi:hypothetical protein
VNQCCCFWFFSLFQLELLSWVELWLHSFRALPILYPNGIPSSILAFGFFANKMLYCLYMPFLGFWILL